MFKYTTDIILRIYNAIFLRRRIAHRIYEDVPLTLPSNALLFNTGGGVRLKLRDSSGIKYKNKTSIQVFEHEIEHESRERQQNPSNSYITLNLNRRRYPSKLIIFFFPKIF